MTDVKNEEFYVDDWVIYTGASGNEYLGKVVAVRDINEPPSFVTFIMPDMLGPFTIFTTEKVFLKKLNSSELLLFLLGKD